ncbi:MAG: hypothetical protein HC920_15615 [Oscillatoriales cyanobacterium SM2_3_0]|nr:hypothetical protein [Oscillatoriales cyanobacterium SM2_3_0]
MKNDFEGQNLSVLPTSPYIFWGVSWDTRGHIDEPLGFSIPWDTDLETRGVPRHQLLGSNNVSNSVLRLNYGPEHGWL